MWRYSSALARLESRTRSAARLLLVAFGLAACCQGTLASTGADVDAGRRIYDAQHCVRCHALAGKGNRLRPLDDVGLRLDSAAIRDRVTAGPGIADRLDKRALIAKQKVARLPATDLDALVLFLGAQRASAPAKPK